MPIAIVGIGYVGLVSAACFADLGVEVYCVDVDEAKIQRLRDGEIPIYEPGLDASCAVEWRLDACTSLPLSPKSCPMSRLSFSAVGTPPDEDARPTCATSSP